MQGIHGGYTPVIYGLANYGSNVYGVNARNNKGLRAPLVAPRSLLPIGLPLVATGARTSVKMAIPDERFGEIIGLGGRTIIEIQQMHGSGHNPQGEGNTISSCLRFLVSNAAAGSIIGKGGSTVSDP